MRMRARLTVTSLVVLLPLAAVLTLLADWNRRTAMEDTVRRIVEERVAAGLNPCDPRPAGPEGGWPPPARRGRPLPGDAVELFAYRADFTPLNDTAPSLTPGQRADLAAGRDWTGSVTTLDGRGVAVAFRLAPPQSCAYLLARMRPRPGVWRDQAIALGLSLVSVVIATWLAAGPVLTRLRRLATAVGRSAADHYATPVTTAGAEDEVTDMARAFNEAAATVRAHVVQVEAREEALREFVANTTHDIAVPLSALQGHLSGLEGRADLGNEGRAQVGHAMQEAHYIGALLRNLGAAARLSGAPDVDWHEVDVAALVERVVIRHRALGRARDVSLDYAVPETAVVTRADLTLLEQAVGNLVDNAIRYNRAGGHVAVVLDVLQDQRYLLAVVDDGPGVPREERTRLLASRTRGTHARTRHPDGQGLGLAIVCDAARLLGLDLRFVDPDEGGLRVELGGPVAAG